MAGYDIPREICPLEKRISDFSVSCGYAPMTVFNDFLMFVIHGFSPGAPPLKNWKYKRRQNIAFMEMTAEWVRLMQDRLKDDESWYDPFGDLYMSLSSRTGQRMQGQFFTPAPICDLMVACTGTGEKVQGKRMNDPTCGSGRLLLAFHVRHLGNYLVGEDLNHTCCLMTVCNMLMHGCVGEVIHHDSLVPDSFLDGWYVNPFLTRTGIPCIRKMSEADYRTGRRLPVNGILERKKLLVENRKRCLPPNRPAQKVPTDDTHIINP